MNRQLHRLYVAIAAGFALLIGITGFWQVWAAPSLQSHRDNLHEVVRELSIVRGRILAADGTVLARNRRARTHDGRTIYLRVYPTRKMFAQVVGYSSPTANRSGLEDSLNDYLTGANTDLWGLLSNALRSATGGAQRGDDVTTTLEPAVQRTAMAGLAATGLRGAVAALDPATGHVLALASWPSYNPNLAIAGGAAWNRLLRGSRAGAPLLLRPTQGLYPPGSTFKVVTAATGLQTGRYTPESLFYDPGYYVEYGRKITNDDGERYGTVTLTEALTHSINSVFAKIGATLCPKPRCPTLTGSMQRFGFYSVPGIDLPDGQVAASGTFTRPGKLASPLAPIDPARTAIGQYTLGATPLQMAMVASGIANHGVIMQPTIFSSARSPSGHVVARSRPQALAPSVSPEVAAELGSMMTHVVDEGTGVPVQIPGVKVAGKTGTAQTSRPGLNDAWFIAFAPADAPRVAVAVVVEDTPGYGAQVAGPIARRVIQAALAQP